MAIVQNSARAFIASVIVIAAFHVIMTSIGLGTFIASNSTPPSPDRALQLLALRVTTDAALLFTGHWLLRSFGLASRLAYGLMGAAVMATGYAFALTNGLMIMPPLEGARLTAALLPMLVGMIAAVMYAQLAGREFCETPADAGNQQSLPHAAAAAPAAFDGPVQVRTSLLAISASALVPAGIVAFIAVPFASAMFGQWDLQSMRRLEWTTQIQQMALPAFLFMMSLLVTAVPATVAVGITHAIARASRRSRGLDYSAIGAAVGAATGLAGGLFFPVVLTIPFGLVAGALMGPVYRYFAGLEPLALPEVVIATNRATLVGEDHPTRRTRAVIMDG